MKIVILILLSTTFNYAHANVRRTANDMRAILSDSSLRAFLNTDALEDQQSLEIVPLTRNSFSVRLNGRCTIVKLLRGPYSTPKPLVKFRVVQCDYFPPPSSDRFSDFTVYDQTVTDIKTLIDGPQFTHFLVDGPSQSFFIRKVYGLRHTFEVFSGNYHSGRFSGGEGPLYTVSVVAGQSDWRIFEGPGGGASVGN